MYKRDSDAIRRPLLLHPDDLLHTKRAKRTRNVETLCVWLKEY